MFYVYAISSRNDNYIYVGLTENLERRFHQHNSGYEKTTRPYMPYDLLYKEEHVTRKDARKREKFFKAGVGKEYLRRLRTEINDQ